MRLYFSLLLLLTLAPSLSCGAETCQELFAYRIAGSVIVDPRPLDPIQQIFPPDVRYTFLHEGEIVAELSSKLEDDLLVEPEFFVYDDGFKRKGISRRLIEQLLQDHPEVNAISVSLIEDNLIEFNKAFFYTDDLLTSVKATPFFKAVAPFGFIYISDIELIEEKKVTFIIERD